MDCRLGLLDAALAQTAADELGGVGLQRKLRSKLTGARQLFAKARIVGGGRGSKTLRRAAGKLLGLLRLVQKAERHRKIEPLVSGPLVDMARKAIAQLGRLQSASR